MMGDRGKRITPSAVIWLAALAMIVIVAVSLLGSKPPRAIVFAMFDSEGQVVQWRCFKQEEGQAAIKASLDSMLDICGTLEKGETVYYGYVWLRHEIEPVESVCEFAGVCRKAAVSPGLGHSFYRITRTDDFFLEEWTDIKEVARIEDLRSDKRRWRWGCQQRELSRMKELISPGLSRNFTEDRREGQFPAGYRKVHGDEVLVPPPPTPRGK